VLAARQQASASSRQVCDERPRDGLLGLARQTLVPRLKRDGHALIGLDPERRNHGHRRLVVDRALVR